MGEERNLLPFSRSAMYSFVLMCYNKCMNNNHTNLPYWGVSYFGNGDGTAQVFWGFSTDDGPELANVVSITDDRWYVMVNGEEICEVNSLEEGKALAEQLIG